MRVFHAQRAARTGVKPQIRVEFHCDFGHKLPNRNEVRKQRVVDFRPKVSICGKYTRRRMPKGSDTAISSLIN